MPAEILGRGGKVPHGIHDAIRLVTEGVRPDQAILDATTRGPNGGPRLIDLLVENRDILSQKRP